MTDQDPTKLPEAQPVPAFQSEAMKAASLQPANSQWSWDEKGNAIYDQPTVEAWTQQYQRSGQQIDPTWVIENQQKFDAQENNYFQWLYNQPTDNYWEDPKKLARWYILDQNLPKELARPAWMPDKETLGAAYSYFQEKNGNTPWYEWKPVDPSDPVRSLLRRWQTPDPADIPDWEQKAAALYANTPADIQKVLADLSGMPDLSAQQQQALEPTAPVELVNGLAKDKWEKLNPQQQLEWMTFASPYAGAITGAGVGAAMGAIMTLPAGGVGAIPGAAFGAVIGTIGQYQPIDAMLRALGVQEQDLPHLETKLMDAMTISMTALQSELGTLSQNANDARLLLLGNNQALLDEYKPLFDSLSPEEQNDPLAVMQHIGQFMRARKEASRVSYQTLPGAFSQNVSVGQLGEPGRFEWSSPDPNRSAQGWVLQQITNDVYRKIHDGESLEAVEKVYAPMLQQLFGTDGMWTSLAASVVLDPLNIIPDAIPKVISVAAEGSNPLLAASMRNTTDIVQGVEKYKQDLKRLPVPELLTQYGSLERWLAGVDASGVRKDLAQVGAVNRNPVQKSFDYLRGATPEARAYEVSRNTYDAVSQMLDNMRRSTSGAGDPDHMVAFYDRIKDLTPEAAIRLAADGENLTVKSVVGGVEMDTPLPRSFTSVELQPALMSLKDANDGVHTLLSQWHSVDLDRALITKAAGALEMDPYKLINILIENGPEGKAAIELALRKGMPDAGKLGEAAGKFFDAKTKRSLTPFSTEEFQGNMALLLTQGAEQWAVKRFGITTPHIVTRVMNVTKSLQGQLLFDYNPSYFINNGLNNIITLAWDGLLRPDMMYGPSRAKMLDRFGRPSFTKSGITQAEVVSGNAGAIEAGLGGKRRVIGTIGEEIRKAQTADDLVGKVQEGIGKVRGKIGIFNQLSSWAEAKTSEMAVASALQEVMGRTWRPSKDPRGGGYRQIPVDLRRELDAVAPGLADQLERAPMKALNVAEVEEAIFSKWQQRSVKDVLNPNEYDVLQKFPDIADQLDRDLGAATDMSTLNTAIDAAFDRASAAFREGVKEKIATGVQTQVEEMVKNIAVEGTQAVGDKMDTVMVDRFEFWRRYQEAMGDAADRAALAPDLEADKIWRVAKAEWAENWNNFETHEAGSWLGVFRGLGIADLDAANPANAHYFTHMQGLSDMHTLNATFFQMRDAEMSSFFEFRRANKADKPAVSAKWAEVSERVNDSYIRKIADEDAVQVRMDDAFTQQFEAQSPGNGASAMQWRTAIRDVRRQMMLAEVAYRTGRPPEGLMKEWGTTLKPEVFAEIQKATGKKAEWLLGGDVRKAAQKAFADIRARYLREMLDASNGNPPGKPVTPPAEPPAAPAAPVVPVDPTLPAPTVDVVTGLRNNYLDAHKPSAPATIIDLADKTSASMQATAKAITDLTGKEVFWHADGRLIIPENTPELAGQLLTLADNLSRKGSKITVGSGDTLLDATRSLERTRPAGEPNVRPTEATAKPAVEAPAQTPEGLAPDPAQDGGGVGPVDPAAQRAAAAAERAAYNATFTREARLAQLTPEERFIRTGDDFRNTARMLQDEMNTGEINIKGQSNKDAAAQMAEDYSRGDAADPLSAATLSEKKQTPGGWTTSNPDWYGALYKQGKISKPYLNDVFEAIINGTEDAFFQRKVDKANAVRAMDAIENAILGRISDSDPVTLWRNGQHKYAMIAFDSLNEQRQAAGLGIYDVADAMRKAGMDPARADDFYDAYLAYLDGQDPVPGITASEATALTTAMRAEDMVAVDNHGNVVTPDDIDAGIKIKTEIETKLPESINRVAEVRKIVEDMVGLESIKEIDQDAIDVVNRYLDPSITRVEDITVEMAKQAYKAWKEDWEVINPETIKAQAIEQARILEENFKSISEKYPDATKAHEIKALLLDFYGDEAFADASWNDFDLVTRNLAKATGVPVDQIRDRIMVGIGTKGMGDALAQNGEPAPVFFSQLSRTVEAIPQERMTVGQLRAAIQKGGVKADEMKWTGLDDWLASKGANDKVTKAEVAEFLRQNEVAVEERVLGNNSKYNYEGNEWQQAIDRAERDGNFDEAAAINRAWEGVDENTGSTVGATQYSQYTTPGGENYRELLFKMPARKDLPLPEHLIKLPEGYSVIHDRSQPEGSQYGIIPDNQGNARPMAGRHATPERAELAAVMHLNQLMDQDWNANNANKADFRAPHFGDEGENLLAHVRFNERIDADGKRVLFIEEVQSDWHQAGREKGYKSESVDALEAEAKPYMDQFYGRGKGTMSDAEWKALGDKVQDYQHRMETAQNGVTPAPFSKTWPDLMMKRMIRWAAENGYDRVAWTPGKMQADRYNLAKQVDNITWARRDNGNYDLSINLKRSETEFGDRPITKDNLTPQDLADTIGKEAAQRIIDAPAKPVDAYGYSGTGVLAGEADLAVGGEGMKTFYDQMLPQTVDKYVKKWGGRTSTTRIEGGGLSKAEAQAAADTFPRNILPVGKSYETVHSFDVTPAMKESVMQGQPMFQGKFGAAFWDEAGRAHIRLLKDAYQYKNFSTWHHEFFHSLLPLLPDADIRTLTRYLGEEAGIKDLPDGWQMGAGHADAKEALARANERYLTEGRRALPLPQAVLDVLAKIKEYMVRIYETIKGSEIDKPLPDYLVEAFDRLRMEQPEAPAPQIGAKFVQPEVTGKTAQPTFFAQGEDTPLFSGTPQSAKGEVFNPQEVAPQDALFNRGEYLPTIGAKKATSVWDGDSSGTTLFQEGTMPTTPPPAVNAPLGTAAQVSQPPVVDALQMGYLKEVEPILRRGRERMKQMPSAANSVMSLEQSLPAETMKKVRGWAGGVYADMSDTKLGATQWAKYRRNQALLDYTERTGMDNTLGVLFPYSFWYTHSMANWAVRALSRPTIITNYMRLRNMQSSQTDKEGFPTRLRNKMGIPAPWLPDWMGQSVFIDPLKQIYPFQQMLRPFENFANNANQVDKRTVQLIEDMAKNETISNAEAQQALNSKKGALWERAATQAELEVNQTSDNELGSAWQPSGARDWVDLAFQVMSPSLPVSFAYNQMTGRQMSPLPIARFVQNVTQPFGVGGPRGLMISRDKFDDYREDRMLAAMAGDGTVSAADAQRAMVERSGPVFDEAAKRAGQIQNLQYWMSALSFDLYPEGEENVRALRDDYKAALQQKLTGANPQAMNEFYDEHPEYETRNLSFEKPEDRLRQMTISQIWDTWSSTNTPNKKAAQDALGDTFNDAFLNKETRSYDSINTTTLVYWAKALGANVPKNQWSTPATEQVQSGPAIKPVDPAINKAYDTFTAQKAAQFPGIDKVYDVYWKLNPGEQRQFEKANPQLKQYQAWKTQYLAKNPAMIPSQISEKSNLYGAPPAVQQYIYQYWAARDTRYPNIADTQTKYFALADKNARKAYLTAHPELPDYWDWRKQVGASMPQAAPWIFSAETLANMITGETSGFTYGGGRGGGKETPIIAVADNLKRTILEHAQGGNVKLSLGIETEVKRMMQRAKVDPSMDMEQFLKTYVLPGFQAEIHPPVLSQEEVAQIPEELIRALALYKYSGVPLKSGSLGMLDALQEKWGIKVQSDIFVNAYMLPALK